MYFFVFRSPILEAFFFTASSGLPSSLATSAVDFPPKSFLSVAMSLFDQSPVFFFAIFRILSLKATTLAIILTTPLLYNLLLSLCRVKCFLQVSKEIFATKAQRHKESRCEIGTQAKIKESFKNMGIRKDDKK